MTGFQIFNFDLSLIRYFWTAPDKAADIIIYHAVHREAQKITVSDADALHQILYLYYRNCNVLPELIADTIYNEIGDGFEESFDGDCFQPSGEIQILLKYSLRDNDFLERCRQWFKFYVSFHGETKFNISYNSDWFSDSRLLLNTYPVDKSVPTSLTRSIILNFPNTPHGIALVAMYAAIRSIIGRKKVAATTRAFIHARMFGAADEKKLEEITKKSKELKKHAAAWLPTKHRVIFKNLLDELQDKNFITWYGDPIHRCLFISLETDAETFSREVASLIKTKEKKSEKREKVASLIKQLTTP